nr:solute carrier family 22 member 21-like [Aedes albopictus]
MVVSLTYFTVMLLSSRMDGNPFLNFLWQSAIELPAYKIGQHLSDSLGRRLSNAMAFLVSTIICIPIYMIARYSEYETLTIALTVAIKFCISINFFAVNLQSIEIYPTCLRNTGLAFAAIMSNLIGILGPYVVYLGTEYDVRYPFVVIGALSAVAAVCALLLPETLHQALPETIEQAQQFASAGQRVPCRLSTSRAYRRPPKLSLWVTRKATHQALGGSTSTLPAHHLPETPQATRRDARKANPASLGGPASALPAQHQSCLPETNQATRRDARKANPASLGGPASALPAQHQSCLPETTQAIPTGR